MTSESNASANYNTFRDCLSDTLIQYCVTQKDASRPRLSGSTELDPVDSSDLGEFIDYIASETFQSLPSVFRNIQVEDADYTLPMTDEAAERALQATPTTVVDSLVTYGLLDDGEELGKLLTPVLTEYIKTLTVKVRSEIQQTGLNKLDECEICGRGWVPLTAHHLVPRAAQAKARKRAWHPEWRMQSIAWLCRACHSFVHRIETNEELARNWSTVELLVGRDDVKKWAAWVGRVRWKAR
ncbi:MAG: hypothetical protein M1825_001274 [Sarcosagium campestre]|nr:MAG: hypothetical protein M1825_001274 [Sarcosagium campestre]